MTAATPFLQAIGEACPFKKLKPKFNMAMMRTIFIAMILTLLASHCRAAETGITVPMDYRLIRNILINQLYTGENAVARVWKDGKECSFLDLSNPKISAEQAQVKIENNVHAKIGLQLGNKCMSAIEWSGLLQTLQKPTLDASGSILSFPLTKAIASDLNGQQLNIKELQDLINKVVQPKFSDLKIDLNQSRGDIIKTLLPFVDDDKTEVLYDTVNSLRFKRVEVGDKALKLDIGFSGKKKKAGDTQPVAVFSADELQQWQIVWDQLEQNMEKSLSKPPLNQQTEADQATLREVFQQAGAAFTEALSEDSSGGKDPVRKFFNESWDKMAPLLRTASNQVPGAEGLRYLTLISATDIMYELESFTAPLGLDVSANGLRKLARSYLSHQTGPKTN